MSKPACISLFNCPGVNLLVERTHSLLWLVCGRFGRLHFYRLGGRIRWVGPNAWRTNGDMFTYDYFLLPLGIMKSPFILNA